MINKRWSIKTANFYKESVFDCELYSILLTFLSLGLLVLGFSAEHNAISCKISTHKIAVSGEFIIAVYLKSALEIEI